MGGGSELPVAGTAAGAAAGLADLADSLERAAAVGLETAFAGLGGGG